MKILRIVGIGAAAIVLLAGGYLAYMQYVANPRVVRELIENPAGERAARVMLLTLPSGRRIPVNYLREDPMVYAAADGGWGSELEGSGVPVTLLVKGETLTGSARTVRDDPAYTKDVFSRLRPDAIEGFGTLVEIRLGGPGG